MSREGSNKHFTKAKISKNDEFYTTLSDIENELRHYKKSLKGKVILCNCDDPRVSNFFHYFSYNFEALDLKKLISTCYKNQSRDLFSRHNDEKAIYLEYDGDINDNKVPDLEEIGISFMKGDGDFRNKESIDLLKQADVVITNPPFSLFREYVAQLLEYQKKFLIVGNWNAITYLDVFKNIKKDKLWIGVNSNRNFKGFIVPKHYPLHGTEARIDENGNRIVSSNNNCWFTNIDIAKRYEKIVLHKKFDASEYPAYDNYNAIEVSQVVKIPKDYDGIMGVPITFIDKYNPEQFEIIGSDTEVKLGLLPKLVKPNWTEKIDRAYLNGKRLYARIFIRLRGN